MHAKPVLIAIALAALIGCASNQTPDVAGKIRDSLKQSGLNNVTVSQDRNKGVVTLGGNVADPAEKARAEQIANPLAAGQVVADEIAVLPPANQSVAKSVDANLDKGVEANLDAAFTQNNINGVHHSTKMGVVTLTGTVNTPQLRQQAERIAAGVPNVQQVVNELDVKNQRATTSVR